MNQRNQGFSLLEVVISLGLLIIIFGLLPLITVIQNANTYNANTTSMTNIAMALSEQLGMYDFDLVGSHPPSCLAADGKVIYGSRQAVCREGPLNQLGYSNLENSTDTNYYYYRWSIVCSNVYSMAGGYTSPICFMPNNNRVTGPVPNTLSCVAANYTNSMKEIKIMVSYIDKKGKCKYTSLKSLKTVY